MDAPLPRVSQSPLPSTSSVNKRTPKKRDPVLSDYSDSDDEYWLPLKRIKVADAVVKKGHHDEFVLIVSPASPYQHWWYTEYADEILTTLRERELERRSYADQSPQIDHRDKMVGLIRFVSAKEGLSRATVHLGKQKTENNHPKIPMQLLFCLQPFIYSMFSWTIIESIWNDSYL